jgi:AcrR family transcriptional regulator
MQVSTKERLVTEAMRLFGEQGYAPTTVAQIESAAGLAPGSGALYHHFESKEALLEAGINRQLDRRQAMRDIRAMFAGLGDLRSELTLMGRYVLNVIDAEMELLRVATGVPPGLLGKLNNAYAVLFDGLHKEFAEWVASWVPDVPAGDAEALSAIGVNALLGRRTTSALFNVATSQLGDEEYVAAWAALLVGHVESLRATSKHRD